jgi:hypothetical protein
MSEYIQFCQLNDEFFDVFWISDCDHLYTWCAACI